MLLNLLKTWVCLLHTRGLSMIWLRILYTRRLTLELWTKNRLGCSHILFFTSTAISFFDTLICYLHIIQIIGVPSTLPIPLPTAFWHTFWRFFCLTFHIAYYCRSAIQMTLCRMTDFRKMPFKRILFKLESNTQFEHFFLSIPKEMIKKYFSSLQR